MSRVFAFFAGVSALLFSAATAFSQEAATTENVTNSEEVTISITSPQDGSLWIGTASRGVLRLGSTGRTYSYSTLTGGVPCDSIKSLAFSSDGRLWMLDARGECYSYSSLTGFVRDDEIPSEVSSVFFPAPSPTPVAEAPVGVPVEVASPWYSRWWTFVLILLFALLPFLLYYFLSARKPAVVEEEKPYAVQEVPVAPEVPVVSEPVHRESAPQDPEVPEPVHHDPAPHFADDSFYIEVSKIVSDRFSDPSFGVEELAAVLGISRVHLSRKLKNSGSPSPSDIIKSVRMERASSLIKEGNTNMAEVASQSGFASAAYFSSAFKEYFGVSPSSYLSGK